MKRLLAVLACLTLPSAAAAQDPNHWAYIGWWDVDYLPGLRGCAATVEFDEGINFLIGIDTSSGEAELAIAVMHRAWDTISEGSSYDLTVQFDSRNPWEVDATGLRLDSLYGLLISERVDSGNAAPFANEFQRSYSMTWRYRGDNLGKLSLKDSRRALDSAIECTQAYLR
ncbi:hypothetical protein [Sinisalibacter aestuarii]|uniref:Uncharacterized protein n=1 Tax=Sinisalibacter aestuarii TaxID=2949426 RepID=A0ABQ5LQM3_9RHOB|nr:hypothetical protein [Sinisalibacter aestuarii]GKY87304.1 hypothetical protein STA1M1_11730 [Sinisalibacter aestuarii]